MSVKAEVGVAVAAAQTHPGPFKRYLWFLPPSGGRATSYGKGSRLTHTLMSARRDIRGEAKPGLRRGSTAAGDARPLARGDRDRAHCSPQGRAASARAPDACAQGGPGWSPPRRLLRRAINWPIYLAARGRRSKCVRCCSPPVPPLLGEWVVVLVKIVLVEVVVSRSSFITSVLLLRSQRAASSAPPAARRQQGAASRAPPAARRQQRAASSAPPAARSQHFNRRGPVRSRPRIVDGGARRRASFRRGKRSVGVRGPRRRCGARRAGAR